MQREPPEVVRRFCNSLKIYTPVVVHGHVAQPQGVLAARRVPHRVWAFLKGEEMFVKIRFSLL